MPAAAMKRQPSSDRPLRDTLFGDAPMGEWPGSCVPATGEPWSSFVKAREAFEGGRQAEAVKIWKKITETPGLESRHYLQTWQFLRTAGTQVPAAKAKQLLGVVIEVPMEEGLNLLAAYPERSARYYNFSGAGVVWERPNDSLDGVIDSLLNNASRILQVIGAWEGARPAAPRAGSLRINLLSAAGLHFGEGAFGALANDPMAKPTVDAAIVLMQRLAALRA